ncbi:hypothetical protein A1OE_853 [Candidatus Endolissoclinum faulkneri L2]|uniref:Uncharacterized protein n=1 Tax=Candidatus Endolissoclinum faulkneri L2 TaxID=1193729 RepID=K7Z4U1_9PROT|nr:hypothetical protein [Candidatus Endolissoclinum faulkneri]AFX99038.1 hypothetical protein A1OE_853 [Candidatus Endolissoclinum faulkneri L2]
MNSTLAASFVLQCTIILKSIANEVTDEIDELFNHNQQIYKLEVKLDLIVKDL